jgi:prepilin-type N-terminal cleavage/methylation domain-containing protein
VIQRRPRSGFTLIEMLVVVIIIVMLSTMAVASLGLFFRGQGVRKGAILVAQGMAWAKQEAARSHQTHFVVFSKKGAEGWLEIHKDNVDAPDGLYQGDGDPKSDDHDPAIKNGLVDLPKGVTFDRSPESVGVSPSGYLSFSGSFGEVQASTFDAAMNGSDPKPIGDIILRVMHKPFVMCMDLDRASGKVRRSFFINEEP